MKRYLCKIVQAKALALMLFAVAGSSAFAQSQDNVDAVELSLEKAVDIAIKENSTLKASKESIKLKENEYKEAWQKLLPELSVVGVLDHTIIAPEMKLNDMVFKMGKDNSNTVNGMLSLNMPLFVPSIYKAMSMTKSDVQLTVEKARASRVDMYNQVKKAYYQLMLARESYLVLQKSYEVAKEQFDLVSKKFEQGLVSEYDKLTAEVQMNSIKPNVVSAENAMQISNLQLNMLLSLPAETKIKTVGSLTDYMTEDKKEVFADGIDLTNNSDIKQLNINKEILDKSVKLARTGFMPNLSLGFSYKYQSLNNPNFRVMDYAWANSSSVSLNLSFPLFKASNYTNLKSAKLQRAILQYNADDVERKINVQAISFRNTMISALEQIDNNRKNIDKAQKALDIASKRYEIGKGTLLEVNSAQISLTQVKLAYTQSVYDYMVAASELKRVLGKEEL